MIVPASDHRSGITSFDAPFWRGDSAEALIAYRKAQRAASRKTRGRRGPRSTIVDNPDLKTLKRLRRALVRRKTEVARQRVQARIIELEVKLGMTHPVLKGKMFGEQTTLVFK